MVKYFILNMMSRIAGLFLILWIARHLEVEEYADFALVTGAIGLATELSIMGLNSSLLKYSALNKDDKNFLRQIYSNSIFGMFVAGLLISIVLCSLPPNFIGPFRENWLIASVGILGSLGLSARSTFLLAVSKQTESALIVLYSVIIRVAIAGFIIISDSHDSTLFIYSYAIPPLLIFLYLEAKSDIKFIYSEISIKNFKEGSKFTRNMFIWALFTSVYWKQDLFLANLLGHPGLIAQADLIFKFSIAAMIIPNMITAYYKPKFIGKSLDSQLAEAKKIMPLLFLIIILIIFGSVVVAYTLPKILAPSYSEISLPIVFACLGNIFFVTAIPLNVIIFSNKEGGLFAAQAIFVCIICGLCTIMLIDSIGIYAIAISYTLAGLIPLILAWAEFQKLINQK